MATGIANRTSQRLRVSAEEARTNLSVSLQERRSEVEQVVLNRVFAVSDASEGVDPEYVAGLRTAVSAALDYGLAVVELGEERAPPVPAALLAQARMAARNGVSLDTVLRRYFAGYSLLSDFLIEEVEDGGLFRGAALKQMMRALATLFDHLLAVVSEEYTREVDARSGTTEQRLSERVQRLLAGELLDTSELPYDFDAHHLGMIVAGPGAAEQVREFAASLDCRLLLVCRDEGATWVWLGSRRGLDPAEMGRNASSSWPGEISLAIGEPGEGLTGWRLTHRQAMAALSVASRSTESFIRYADVALLASTLQDDLLATSLRELYLAPLHTERNGGETLRETLRAYFRAGCNVSSAAAALGVSRRTVANRLRAIEGKLGCPLNSAAVEMEVALRLHEFDTILSI